MSRLKINFLIFALLIAFGLSAQPGFDFETYNAFRQANESLTSSQLSEMFSMPEESYYKGFENVIDFDHISYLDSVILKMDLTEDEIDLLKKNLFFVTERNSPYSFGHAFHNVYSNDLPVFITTDAILHALHKSYDEILKTVEREIMSSNLEQLLESMYNNFRIIVDKYGENDQLEQPLKDAGLYITMLYSLIKDELQPALEVDRETLTKVWEAVKSEQMTEMSLFAEHTRKLDFSQFTVRGHYVYTEMDKLLGVKSLEPYFRTMMWLGRIDFFLTPPADNPWEEPWPEEDILRMNLAAFMVNELFQTSEKFNLFQQNEEIINYLVGESDNITPSEYQHMLDILGIESATQLLNSETYNNLITGISGNPDFSQKILSNFFLMDPYADKPDELPVSFRLSGQRFIIDSYIFSNVVYDRIIFNGGKIWRPMPHPFDALFALGNNDVLPLLEEELDNYPYAGALANMRYLVDTKPDEFWSESLYNVWLNSIRKLNPVEFQDGMPLFMKSAAWQHEKMNTQLAGWAQLRHDNLLYTKQSYTGGTACSFPYSYIEPYPDFFANVKQFASDAAGFFNNLPVGGQRMNEVTRFFRNFAEVNEKLEILADKELLGESFNSEENDWLKTMLFADGESGRPPFSGWYSDLFFDPWHASEEDFTIADVHTQPTDLAGNVVGKVLHVGTGKVNFGVFIVNCPADQKPMAFVGPVMSYYQDITNNFKRMTDQEWKEKIWQGNIPERSDWTNIYLASSSGETGLEGPELPSKLYSANNEYIVSNEPVSISVYPNPFENKMSIRLKIEENSKIGFKLINSMGSVVYQISAKDYMPGLNHIEINSRQLTSGFYILKAEINSNEYRSWKVLKK